MLKKLWQYLSQRRKKQFGLLLALMILASFTEMISVGAVLPFLGVLTAPEEVFHHPFMQATINGLEQMFGIATITEPDQLILPLTSTIGGSYSVNATLCYDKILIRNRGRP